MCERWVETGTDCYIDPSSSLDHSSTSSWVGCSIVGHWGPSSPQSASWFSRWHSCLNCTRPARAPAYIDSWHPPVSAPLRLIYTGASLDWRLGQGSIYKNHPILIFQNSTCGHFPHVPLHPPLTHILQIMLKDNHSKNTKRNYLNNSKIQKSSLEGDLFTM